MAVTLINYGMGNLGSVTRALQEVGGEVRLAETPEGLCDADHLVLPGVGAFGDGMRALRERGFIEPLRECVSAGTPLLGICLGMQLLADTGVEGGESAGLGFIPGHMEKLTTVDATERIPHVGWNEIHHRGDTDLLEAIPNGTDFYFVHSYHFVPAEEESASAHTPYCGGFVSVVARENVFGVQFHPEKSQRPGFQLLRNFLET